MLDHGEVDLGIGVYRVRSFVAVQPEKHTAYAVQWFVMAAVLLVMTLIANSNVGSWIKQFRRP